MCSANGDILKKSVFKGVLSLALPLMLSALLQSTQSLIDIFWVGRLGAEAVAGVAMSGIVMMLVFTFVVGISSGSMSLVSKNIGHGNAEGANIVAGQVVLLGILLSLLAAGAAIRFSSVMLKLLGARGNVFIEGEEYLRILLFGASGMIFLFLSNSILQGAGDVTRPMIFLCIANILNLILDPIFIFGLDMGTKGAAWATILAQGISALCVLVLFRTRALPIFIKYRDIKIRTDVIKDLFRIGIPISGQMFFRSVVNMSLLSLLSGFGTIALASFGIIMRIHMTILMPAFALGIAATTLTGQNLGVGNAKQAERSIWTATFIDLFIMGIVGILFLFLSESIVGFFTSNSGIIETASQFLRISAFFYPFIAFGLVINKGMGGAGDTFIPMCITLFSLLIYLLPMAYYLSKYIGMGVSGVWWAFATSHAVNGILTIIWFGTGRWKKKAVEIYN